MHFDTAFTSEAAVTTTSLQKHCSRRHRLGCSISIQQVSTQHIHTRLQGTGWLHNTAGPPRKGSPSIAHTQCCPLLLTRWWCKQHWPTPGGWKNVCSRNQYKIKTFCKYLMIQWINTITLSCFVFGVICFCCSCNNVNNLNGNISW